LLWVAAAASCRLGYDESASAAGTGGAGAAKANGGNSSSGTNDAGGSSLIDAGASSTLGGAGGEPTTPEAGSGGHDTGGVAGSGSGSGSGGGGGTAGDGGSGGTACTSTVDCTCQEFQGHTYWFCANATNWADAELRCGLANMSLVRIDSQAENDFLVDRGTPLGVFGVNGFAQIGANDQAVDGEWRWTDGTQLWAGDAVGGPVNGAFTNWLAGSPSAGGIKNCSGILLLGTWQDRSCTAVVPSICESP
jgi:hypothetical protein